MDSNLDGSLTNEAKMKWNDRSQLQMDHGPGVDSSKRLKGKLAVAGVANVEKIMALNKALDECSKWGGLMHFVDRKGPGPLAAAQRRYTVAMDQLPDDIKQASFDRTRRSRDVDDDH
eukprot:12410863-Karenia_brevis.AAC.1